MKQCSYYKSIACNFHYMVDKGSLVSGFETSKINSFVQCGFVLTTSRALTEHYCMLQNMQPHSRAHPD